MKGARSRLRVCDGSKSIRNYQSTTKNQKTVEMDNALPLKQFQDQKHLKEQILVEGQVVVALGEGKLVGP